MYGEILAVCSEIHTKHTKRAGYDAEFFNVKPGGTYINRLTPNDPYMGRTAPLTSKRCILQFIQQI